MAVQIIVDSASDIGQEEAKALGLIMLPMTVSFGEEDFQDGVDLTPAEFYAKLTSGKEMPKTSQVTPFRFEEEFQKCVASGDEVVAILISSKLSATCSGAQMAAEKFPGKVFVVDSLSAAIGERMLAYRALELRKEGKSAAEIADHLDSVKEKMHVLAVVDTLEYLKRGGRISAAVAFAGTLLSIKPLVGVVNGEVKMLGKALGVKKANALLNSVIEKYGIDQSLPYGAIWAGNDRTNLDNYLATSSLLPSDAPICILGGTIGTHVGPGAFGIAFFEK